MARCLLMAGAVALLLSGCGSPRPIDPDAGPVTGVRAQVLGMRVPSAGGMTVSLNVVRDLQTELAARGYDPGPVDGVMGPQTRAAIRRFQERQGLAVTGEATSELLTLVRAQPR